MEIALTFVIGMFCGAVITWQRCDAVIKHWRDHAHLMQEQRDQMSDDFLRLIDIATIAPMSKKQQVKELQRMVER